MPYGQSSAKVYNNIMSKYNETVPVSPLSVVRLGAELVFAGCGLWIIMSLEVTQYLLLPPHLQLANNSH